MSRDRAKLGQWRAHGKPPLDPLRGMFSGWIASAGHSGTRSIGCQTGANCSVASARHGPSAGRPAAGYFTKRTAEAWLRDVLDEARRGTLPGLVKTGVTFADAAAEWLRYVEHDRDRKPSTIAGYKAIAPGAARSPPSARSRSSRSPRR